MVSSYDQLTRVFEDTKQLVHSMINCDKPIISAINGVAVCTIYLFQIFNLFCYLMFFLVLILSSRLVLVWW